MEHAQKREQRIAELESQLAHAQTENAELKRRLHEYEEREENAISHALWRD
jgi:uncharacterized protein (DUF3084 family)